MSNYELEQLLGATHGLWITFTCVPSVVFLLSPSHARQYQDPVLISSSFLFTFPRMLPAPGFPFCWPFNNSSVFLDPQCKREHAQLRVWNAFCLRNASSESLGVKNPSGKIHDFSWDLASALFCWLSQGNCVSCVHSWNGLILRHCFKMAIVPFSEWSIVALVFLSGASFCPGYHHQRK